MRKLLILLPFTAACASSIDGNWVLSEVDQDALEETLDESFENEPTFNGFTDVDLSMQMSIDEDLGGTIDYELELRTTYVVEGDTYIAKITTDANGVLSAEKSESSYLINVEVEGTNRTEIPDLQVDETEDITDTVKFTIENCELDGDKLTCTEWDGSDITLTFSR